MSRALSPLALVMLLTALVGSGCDIFLGPSPLNDAPVIESFGRQDFVNSAGEVIETRAYITIAVDQIESFEIVATEPEGEELTAALRSHQAEIKAQQYTTEPDSNYPTIERESKGGKSIIALVFTVSLLACLIGVFMKESMQDKRPA